MFFPKLNDQSSPQNLKFTSRHWKTNIWIELEFHVLGGERKKIKIHRKLVSLTVFT